VELGVEFYWSTRGICNVINKLCADDNFILTEMCRSTWHVCSRWYGSESHIMAICRLKVCPPTPPRCKISQISVASKWQLASRLHLLQIGCLPNVLVSIVLCLTDHPCRAAGSSKNQNHNAEEHLDAGSVTVCLAEMLSAVDIQWRNVH